MITRSRAYQLRALIERAAKSLDDGDALDGIELFPAWEKNTEYAQDIRVRYDRKLYRCNQAHKSQVGWEPPMVPALWTEVPRPGEGDTPSNPIHYEGNMALVSGKYYEQDGTVYRCFRDTINPVYAALRDLVGIYVEEVAV